MRTATLRLETSGSTFTFRSVFSSLQGKKLVQTEYTHRQARRVEHNHKDIQKKNNDKTIVSGDEKQSHFSIFDQS